MYKQVFTIIMCLWGACFIKLNAQAVIPFSFQQPAPLEILTDNVTLVFPVGGVEIGADLVITGGSGEYTYKWTHNNEVLGTGPTLYVEEEGAYYLTVTDGNDCNKSVRFFIGEDTAISIIESKMMTVYPNPTHGDVYMESSLCDQVTQITVVSLEGKLVAIYDHPECKDNTIRIEISHLPKGTYLVSYIIEKKIITKQVILL